MLSLCPLSSYKNNRSTQSLLPLHQISEKGTQILFTVLWKLPLTAWRYMLGNHYVPRSLICYLYKLVYRCRCCEKCPCDPMSSLYVHTDVCMYTLSLTLSLFQYCYTTPQRFTGPMWMVTIANDNNVVGHGQFSWPYQLGLGDMSRIKYQIFWPNNYRYFYNIVGTIIGAFTEYLTNEIFDK